MRQTTGFHIWGLLIVRATSYEDEHNRRWETFLSAIRADAERPMTRKPPGRPKDEETPALLLPLLRWDTLENHGLEDASVEDAKKALREWRAGTCSARDGDGADHVFVC